MRSLPESILRLDSRRSGGLFHIGWGNLGLSIFQTIPRQLHFQVSTSGLGLHRFRPEKEKHQRGTCRLHLLDLRTGSYQNQEFKARHNRILFHVFNEENNNRDGETSPE